MSFFRATTTCPLIPENVARPKNTTHRVLGSGQPAFLATRLSLRSGSPRILCVMWLIHLWFRTNLRRLANERRASNSSGSRRRSAARRALAYLVISPISKDFLSQPCRHSRPSLYEALRSRTFDSNCSCWSLPLFFLYASSEYDPVELEFVKVSLAQLTRSTSEVCLSCSGVALTHDTT